MVFFLHQVQNWLERVFGGNPVPQYEINEDTIGILHRLMKKNESQDRAVSMIVDDLKQKALEYKAEGVVYKPGICMYNCMIYFKCRTIKD